MDWITQAAKEREDARNRRESIVRGTPVVWDAICQTMEQAVSEYQKVEVRPRQAKLSSRSANAVHVTVFEKTGQSSGTQLGRVAIVLNKRQNMVEIRTAVGVGRKLPVGLSQDGRACLLNEGVEVPLEEFARIALFDMFFPKDDGASADLED